MRIDWTKVTTSGAGPEQQWYPRCLGCGCYKPAWRMDDLYCCDRCRDERQPPTEQIPLESGE